MNLCLVREQGRVLRTVGVDVGEVGVREVCVEDCQCCVADMQNEGLGSKVSMMDGEEWEGKGKGGRTSW